MGFLPQDFQEPKQTGGYMKLQKGKNKLRVLGDAVAGWEYWNTDNKPVHSKEEPQGVPADIRRDEKGKPVPIKYFLAFPVWNYQENEVQILEVTQASIRRPLVGFAENEDWGDPQGYDITIERVGDGLETDYSVIPHPHKEAPKEALEAYAEMTIDLEKLFSGENPFEGESNGGAVVTEEELTEIGENF